MNKAQIQQKFDEILRGLGHEFWSDGTLSTSFVTKNDLIDLIKAGFNLGLEVAADNALIEEEIPEEERDVEYEESPIYHSGGYIRNEHYVQVDKKSILKFKI